MAIDYKTIIDALEMFELPTNQFISEKTIKHKYMRLAKYYHPDTTPIEKYKNGVEFDRLKDARDYLMNNIALINENILNIDDYKNNQALYTDLYNKEMVICSFCGAKNPIIYEKCECCGTTLVLKEKKICPYCESQNDQDAIYCNSCGKKFKEKKKKNKKEDKEKKNDQKEEMKYSKDGIIIKNIVFPNTKYTKGMIRFQIIFGMVGVLASALGFMGLISHLSKIVTISFLMSFFSCYMCHKYNALNKDFAGPISLFGFGISITAYVFIITEFIIRMILPR